MIASLSGYVEVVRLLLDRGANIDEKDNFKNTALMFASTKNFYDNTNNIRYDNQDNYQDNYSKIIELLLLKDANTNINNIEGDTALTLAIKYGHNDIVELLNKNTKE